MELKNTTTCIVGIVDGKKVFIGSDSAAVGYGTITPTTFSKCFIVKNKKMKMAIGYTSSFRMGQVLEYEFVPPLRPASMDVMKYMVTKFIPVLKECFKKHWRGHDVKVDSWGGCFLVGYAGRLFQIYSDFQVNESTYGYDATGCGETWALGSLHTTQTLIKNPLDNEVFSTDLHLDPIRRLEMALEAATTFSTGVCGPFNFVQV